MQVMFMRLEEELKPLLCSFVKSLQSLLSLALNVNLILLLKRLRQFRNTCVAFSEFFHSMQISLSLSIAARAAL